MIPVVFFLNDSWFSSRFMIHEDFWSPIHLMMFSLIGYLRSSKTSNKKRAICFETWLQNELHSDVARFTTHLKKPYNLISCKTGSNMGGKTRNIAISAAVLQNKLHVFCCPFYCSFSLVLCSFFGVQTSVFIKNYVDFGPLFLGIIIHFVQVWSFFVIGH